MRKFLTFLIGFVGFFLIIVRTVSAQTETPWGKLDAYAGFSEETETAVVVIMHPSRDLTEAIAAGAHHIRTEIDCQGEPVTGAVQDFKTGTLFLMFEHDCPTEPKTGAFIWEENGSEKRLELKFGETDTDAATVITPTKPAENLAGKKIQIDSDNGKRTLIFKRYVLSLWDMKVWINGAYINIPRPNGAPVKPFDIEVVCGGTPVASKASQYDKTENAFVFRVDCTSEPSAIYVVYQKDGRNRREMIYGSEVDPADSDAGLSYVFRNLSPVDPDVYNELRKSGPITNGTCQIKIGMGEKWFGPHDTFGHPGTYKRLVFGENGSSSVTFDSGFVYTLRINTGIAI